MSVCAFVQAQDQDINILRLIELFVLRLPEETFWIYHREGVELFSRNVTTVFAVVFVQAKLFCQVFGKVPLRCPTIGIWQVEVVQVLQASFEEGKLGTFRVHLFAAKLVFTDSSCTDAFRSCSRC